jgi:hypothetical protein
MWLIGTAFAFLALWLCQLAADLPKLPRLPRRRPPAPHVPHWARMGHLPLPPASSSAATGRHRRGASS